MSYWGENRSGNFSNLLKVLLLIPRGFFPGKAYNGIHLCKISNGNIRTMCEIVQRLRQKFNCS